MLLTQAKSPGGVLPRRLPATRPSAHLTEIWTPRWHSSGHGHRRRNEITVAGSVTFTEEAALDSKLSVVGGTGRYNDVGGELTVVEIPKIGPLPQPPRLAQRHSVGEAGAPGPYCLHLSSSY